MILYELYECYYNGQFEVWIECGGRRVIGASDINLNSTAAEVRKAYSYVTTVY